VAAARERLAHLYKSPNIEPMAAKYGLRSQEALERYEAAQRILNAKDLKDLEQYDYRTAEPLKFWAAEFRDRGFKFNAEVVRIAAEADALNRKGLEGELTDAERERMNSLYKQKLEMLAKMNPAVHKVGEEKDYYGMQYDEPRRVVITGTRFNDTSGRLYDIKDPQDPGIHYTGARDEQLFEPGARNPQHDLERAESRVRRAHATVANIGKWADLKSQGERQAYQRAKQESANAERELFNLRKELAGGKGKEPAAPELPSFPGPDRALARQGAIRRMINNYGNDVPGDKPTLTVDEAIAQEEADVRKLMAMPSWQPQDIEMATWVLHELRQLKQEGFTLPGKAAPPAPPAGPEPVNHVLPADQDFIPSGDKAKARANLDAIALLKKLEAEGRNPTPEEAKVLAQYTGWGGLQQVFDHGKAAYRERPPWAPEQKREFENWEKGWGKIYDEVKAALTTEEYAAAGKSILNAHYTSRDVINWIWKAVERLGFKGGKALEPAGGIGHFVGLTPESVRGKTRWTASELDSTSARIMAKLYPNARVHQMGFQDAKIAPNSQDLVVSNFPFEAKGPSDSRYPRMSLHNYFFARSLDLVKPGGLVAAITSDSTMDNTGASREAREYMAGKADLVGAIRLPNNAFKKNAGTEVTTDILFFRKRDGTPFKGEDFLRTGEYGSGKDKVEINEYYLKHPDMMLGRMGTEGTMRREGQQALTPIPGADLNRQLEEAVGKLPANVVTGSQPEADTGKGAYYTPKEITAKVGQLVHRGDEVLQYTENGELEKPDWAGDKKKVEQAKRYVSVRGITGELIRKMNDPNATEAEVTADRATLNKEYDAYVKKHGPLNGRASAFLDDDVDYPMALALEDPITKLVQEPGKKARRVTEWVKSKIFSERTIFPRVAPTSVDTVPDAVQVSQNFRGRIDPEYIAKLTNKPVEQVHQELTHSGLAFENPASGQWENRSTYLSGFVKKKLKEAVAAAQADPKYGPNVDALRKVQPEPIPLEQIGVKLGAVWVPPSVIERFVRDTLGVVTGAWLRAVGRMGTGTG
jgi:hypothetical protein